MSTHRNTWKAAERRIAASFGARRQIGSGSLGRDDRSSSDSTHETLYIEAKYRKRHTAVALHDDTAKKAKKEGKIPVVVMVEKNRPGTWLLIKQENLPAIAAEYAKARLAEIKELPGQTTFIDEGES